ncbi:hypothetical protein [Streptomyces albireticuli]|uniref:hypothetical protein n=1 Tax=Streptomyces albireticuli TaxID=1940 RepID=UPI0036806CBC
MTLLDGMTPERLRKLVAPLLADPARRLGIAERARAHGRPDAADRLVDVVLTAVSS